MARFIPPWLSGYVEQTVSMVYSGRHDEGEVLVGVLGLLQRDEFGEAQRIYDQARVSSALKQCNGQDGETGSSQLQRLLEDTDLRSNFPDVFKKLEKAMTNK